MDIKVYVYYLGPYIVDAFFTMLTAIWFFLCVGSHVLLKNNFEGNLPFTLVTTESLLLSIMCLS